MENEINSKKIKIDELNDVVNQLISEKEKIEKEISDIEYELSVRTEDLILTLVKDINEKFNLITELGYEIKNYGKRLNFLSEVIDVDNKKVEFFTESIDK